MVGSLIKWARPRRSIEQDITADEISLREATALQI